MSAHKELPPEKKVKGRDDFVVKPSLPYLMNYNLCFLKKSCY